MTQFYIIILLFISIPAVAAELTTKSSTAIFCRSDKPHNRAEWWAYRVIDGKQCWYPGRPGMSKNLLSWQRKPVTVEAVEPDENTCCWGWPLK